MNLDQRYRVSEGKSGNVNVTEEELLFISEVKLFFFSLSIISQHLNFQKKKKKLKFKQRISSIIALSKRLISFGEYCSPEEFIKLESLLADLSFIEKKVDQYVEVYFFF